MSKVILNKLFYWFRILSLQDQEFMILILTKKINTNALKMILLVSLFEFYRTSNLIYARNIAKYIELILMRYFISL
jgi:hypothetical protein